MPSGNDKLWLTQRDEQTVPTDVYLLNEANPWVAQRGGLMGIGSRRVMGVGLPLFQALSVTEWRTRCQALGIAGHRLCTVDPTTLVRPKIAGIAKNRFHSRPILAARR